jgi:cell division protein FtsB
VNISFKKATLAILVSLSACCTSFAAGRDCSKLLLTLDTVVIRKQKYTDAKLERIDKLKSMLPLAESDEQTYKLLAKIFDEYRAYNMDSSYLYATKKFGIARRLGDSDYLADSRMNMAEVYGTTGMYKEAIESLSAVRAESLGKTYIPYYYHLYRTIYGLMSDYSISSYDKAKYMHLRDIYRDSLLSVNTPGTYLYTLIQSDGLNSSGKSLEAKELLNSCLDQNKNSEDAVRTLAYTLATAYRNLGDTANAEYYLAQSALSDLKQASKEYSALLDLSMMLYQEGDLKRAYDYMKCSMEDAAYCNARLRTIEISHIFPIVDNAYQKELERRNRQRTTAMIIEGMLALALLAALIVVFLQIRKLAKARKELQAYSENLKNANESLLDSNRSLTDANLIKAEIIQHYLDLSSIYVDKINRYRASLIKIGTYENAGALFTALRSTQFMENELKEFYDIFDETFLKLFPTFVKDFNALLNDEGKICPKVDGKLNTELRVFALIRLGVTDSEKIAQFLRCSVTTIYNYRVKVRNSALGERARIEEKVMDIGTETH